MHYRGLTKDSALLYLREQSMQTAPWHPISKHGRKDEKEILIQRNATYLFLFEAECFRSANCRANRQNWKWSTDKVADKTNDKGVELSNGEVYYKRGEARWKFLAIAQEERARMELLRMVGTLIMSGQASSQLLAFETRVNDIFKTEKCKCKMRHLKYAGEPFWMCNINAINRFKRHCWYILCRLLRKYLGRTRHLKQLQWRHVFIRFRC